MQDMGGMSVLRELCPEIPLHVSTQAAVHNSKGVNFMKQMGAKRVVLARELTRAQIENIDSDMELEVFAHGALCVCYSGRCLMSSFIGGRSANRGMCAGTCRLPYTAGEKSGYLLSAKDLCLVRDVQRLQKSGVHCIKIEGRMKRPEYVASVTRVYRRVLDGEKVTGEDMDALLLAFNRGGFTRGRFGGATDILHPEKPDNSGILLGKIVAQTGNEITVKTGRTVKKGDEICPSEPDAKPQVVTEVKPAKGGLVLRVHNPRAFTHEVTLLKQGDSFAELTASVKGNARKMSLSAHFSLTISGGSLYVYADDGYYAHTECPAPEPARNRSITEEVAVKQLKKTGDAPFLFEEITCDITPGLSLPISALNEMRRRALADISRQILHKNPPKFGECKGVFHKKTVPFTPKLSVVASSREQYIAVRDFADILYVPMDMKLERRDGQEIIGMYPPVMSDDEYEYLCKFEEGFDGILSSQVLKTYKKIVADFDMNVTNSHTAELLEKLGFSRIGLSRELNSAQIKDIVFSDNVESEVCVYGYTPLMITEQCPLDCNKKICAVKRGGATIKDRLGKEFALVHTGVDCRVRILNSLPLFMADRLNGVSAHVFRLEFTVESPETCAEIAKMYREALQGKQPEPPKFQYTRGHFSRGI